MQTFGIDVSVWQGNFDFKKAKDEGVKFAILRGAYTCPTIDGGGKDTRFEEYYKNAKAAGLPVGVYQYSRATTVTQAKAEAQFMVDNVLKGKQFELPIYIDIEDAAQEKLGKRKLTDIIKAWCSYLEGKGYYVGVYSTAWWFGNMMYDSELQGYTHWIAQWAAACTYVPMSVVGMWQFGGETNVIRSNKVAGVVCDQNYMYKDFPTEIKKLGLNGFKKPASSSTTTTQPTKPTQVATSVKLKINGTNTTRRTNQLIVYNKGAAATTNKWGAEVAIDKNGIATSNPVYGVGNMKIPAGGFVLSGHGTMSSKLIESVKNGYKVAIKDGYAVITKTANAIRIGDTVKVTNPIIYGTSNTFKLWYEKYTVMELSGNRAVIGVNGAATAAIDIKNLKKV